MYYYVYKLVDLETNEFYIGSRSSKVDPNIDNYMGSMKTWKPDKTKLSKFIIQSFNNIKDMEELEKELIKKHIEEELNRNYHIPNIGFQTTGMINVRDNNGKCFLIKKDDPRYVSGELVSATKGTQIGLVVVSDENGKKFKIDKNDPRYVLGELKSFNIGKKLKLNKRLDINHSSKKTQIGDKNSQFGTMWIYNPELGLNKKIKKDDEIPIGWIKGRKQKITQ